MLLWTEWPLPSLSWSHRFTKVWNFLCVSRIWRVAFLCCLGPPPAVVQLRTANCTHRSNVIFWATWLMRQPNNFLEIWYRICTIIGDSCCVFINSLTTSDIRPYSDVSKASRPHNFYSMGTGLHPGDKAALAWSLTLPSCTAEFKNERNIASALSYAFSVCTGRTLPLSVSKNGIMSVRICELGVIIILTWCVLKDRSRASSRASSSESAS